MNLLRKKLLYKSLHRGCKETDIILGEFAKVMIEKLTDGELKAFSDIIEASDNTIYAAAVGRVPIPDCFDKSLFRRIITFSQNRIISNEQSSEKQ